MAGEEPRASSQSRYTSNVLALQWPGQVRHTSCSNSNRTVQGSPMAWLNKNPYKNIHSTSRG